MGFKQFMQKVFSGEKQDTQDGRDRHAVSVQDPEPTTPSTTLAAAQPQPQTEPAKVDKRFTPPKSWQRFKVKHGHGMFSLRGRYLSPHDVRCRELSGCDMGVLADLLIGEIPNHAPNSEGPHPLSTEYMIMKAKEKEARYAKTKTEEVEDTVAAAATAGA